MAQSTPLPESAAGGLAPSSALKSQYHAGLGMLRQAIDRCPERLWTGDEHASPFWHIAYHTLFYTHLYLQPEESAFRPWEHHREEYQFMGRLPWPPHRPPDIDVPYTKTQILQYWQICEEMVDATVDGLDLNAAECGFWWYSMPKFEHQLVNIRHLQHHTAQLSDRLRSAADIGIDWLSAGTTSEQDKAG